MKSISIVIPALLFFLLYFFISSASLAQHFVSMTDEQSIQLALDMIRKGIQQQDTTKIMKVVAKEVSIKDGAIELKSNMSRKFQNLFDNSHKREIALQKPPFPRADNPLHFSNFWDFDILNPKITIEGDSAVVECELVLWGAASVQDSYQKGKKTKEKLVYKIPPEVEKSPSSGDCRMWPSPPSGTKRMSNIRNWKLVRFEKLFDFLNREVESLREQDK